MVTNGNADSLRVALILLAIPMLGTALLAQETLPPLVDGKAPQTFDALWAEYDPRAEPLDVEVLKEWEEDGVVMKVLRYRIGIFKGQKAMMAAIYGYPKGGDHLPGLVQIHGGGQYADYRAPLTNAQRGYATLSISWAGRINAPGYKVTPTEVRLFWEGKTDHPAYKVTTDWGALDAYHAPTRYAHGSFGGTKPAEWTLDSVESPRNNQWFLCTLGARRALTFLEQQPEVDESRLGVYGHSMGGKLTVLTAGADSRVKAAVPSCGGISHRSAGKSPSGDDVSLEQITCPILFQSPANDFHGRIDDLQTAVKEIQSKDWRVTCSPHHNHQDTAHYEVASQLWFDQQLQGRFAFPATPVLAVNLKAKGGIPTVLVTPDPSKPILAVEVYYTRQGQVDGLKDDRDNTMNRFWHYAEATQQGEQWSASLPLSNTDQPLWVYANVTYPLEQPTAYAGYYYRVGSSEAFGLSSLMFMATARQLKAAGVQAARKPSRMIETFGRDWEKQWFTYTPADWGRKTHKVYDALWKAPADAKLALEVRTAQANKLVVGIDSYAAEVKLAGGREWQSMVLSLVDFRNAAGVALKDWEGIMELRLGATETRREKVDGKNVSRKLGAAWQGPDPEFRNLRWIASAGERQRFSPNIVMVLCDDLGYGDVHCLNPERGKIATPHVDELARAGMIFTDAHSGSSVCTPTRYGLLTGRYSWRTRLQKGVVQGYQPNLIAANRFTVAGLLKAQGYRTGIVGKWHLDFEYVDPATGAKLKRPKGKALPPVGAKIPDGPLSRGFDFFHGFHHARDMRAVIENDTVIAHDPEINMLPRLAREAVGFIDACAAESTARPFFLYVPLGSPHTPIVPTQAWQGKSGLGPYADFVMQTDAAFGAIMDALEKHGFTENTLVIFGSDNGCSKAAGIPTLNAQGHYPSAHLRGSKADIWDGGHRIPFVVRWPGMVAVRSTSNQLICLTDLLATCAEIVGITLPDTAGEDSVSFLPALQGNPIVSTRAGVIHHSISGHFAYRQGPWKLLLARGSGGWTSPREKEVPAESPPAQLYNLEEDPGETTNLYETHSDVAERLLNQLQSDVQRGRSTAGQAAKNDVDEVVLWKSGR